MIVKRTLPFDRQLSCIISDYHQLPVSWKFFMIVDGSFSRLTTRMIIHHRFLVSCLGNHWPDSGHKTWCRSLLSRKIHTFKGLWHGTPFSAHIFKRKELGTRCSRDFACATAGELSTTITPFFGRLTIWMIVNNYSPKWRWLAVDIYRAATRRGKYQLLATDTEVNSCFSIY